MDIKIYKQKRRSMMLRPFPGGIEVYIPYQFNENHPSVKRFINEGIKKFKDAVPDVPPEITSRATILALVDDYAQRMTIRPTRVQLRDMRRKWGSCSSKGTVTLNSRLMWLERPIVEYIICHELAHLIELNHSKRFWAIVEQHMPDYRERMKQLRDAEKHLY